MDQGGGTLGWLLCTLRSIAGPILTGLVLVFGKNLGMASCGECVVTLETTIGSLPVCMAGA